MNEAGVKYDADKVPVVRGAFHYFPRALTAVARVSAAGANKYTWKGWETVPDGATRYTDALGRHLLAETETPIDEETGCLHAAQVAWNALARLELMLRDDQENPGNATLYPDGRGLLSVGLKELPPRY